MVALLFKLPICCETKASSPRVIQKVFLKWPPKANVGGISSSNVITGTNPRARRIKRGLFTMIVVQNHQHGSQFLDYKKQFYRQCD